MKYFNKTSTFFLLCLVIQTFAKTQERPNYHNDSTSKSRQSNLYLTLFESYSGSGTRYTYVDYTNDLTTMDDRASSSEVYGIWLMYDNYFYNDGTPGRPSYWTWGEDYTSDVAVQFDNLASSAKFTGAPDDYRAATINFYEYEGFGGDEDYTYSDATQLNYDNLANSIVVTGCEDWTVYEYDNYQGYSCCMFADLNNCDPVFYPFSSDLGYMAGRISSVRKDNCQPAVECRNSRAISEKERQEREDARTAVKSRGFKSSGGSGFFPGN